MDNKPLVNLGILTDHQEAIDACRELLESLEGCYKEFFGMNPEEFRKHKEIAGKVRAAIAKAKGE